MLEIDQLPSKNANVQGFIQLTTPNLESTPPSPKQVDPRRRDPPNFGMLQRSIKWQKTWKLGDKMGKKSICHWDFCMEIWKFSQKFQIIIGFRPNVQRFAARFLTFF